MPLCGTLVRYCASRLTTASIRHTVGNSIYRGVLTGYNDAFIVPTEVRDRLIAEDPASEDILKPILRGRDIRPYRAQWAGLWLISTFPSAGININAYPAVRDHLLRFGKRRLEQSGTTHSDGMKSRKKTPHDWFELQDSCAYHEEFYKEKVIWIELVDRGRFAYDATGLLVEATAFMMTGTHVKSLCAVLNPSFARWFLLRSAPTSGLGTLRWKKVYVGELPVPPLDNRMHNRIAQVIDLASNVVESSESTESMTRQVDELLFRAYGLTDEESDQIRLSARRTQESELL